MVINIKLKKIIAIVAFFLPLCAFAVDYKMGPVGGTGGYAFQKRIAGNERICGVYVRHGSRIDAIQLRICDNSGNSYRSTRFGGSGGTESYFPIYSNEYLSGFTTFIGKRYSGRRIFGLMIEKRQIGSTNPVGQFSKLYGSKTKQNIVVDGWRSKGTVAHMFDTPTVLGIYGRSAKALDSIGVIYSSSDFATDNQMIYRAGVGTNSGSTSKIFPVSGRICAIEVRHAARIDALRFKDCKSTGGSALSTWFGGNGGSHSKFSLRAGEQLRSIQGTLITRSSGAVTFSSIKFVTNFRTSPTYGAVTSRPFTLDIPKEKRLSAISSLVSKEVHNLDLSFN